MGIRSSGVSLSLFEYFWGVPSLVLISCLISNVVMVHCAPLRKAGSNSLINYPLSHGPTDVFVQGSLELLNFIYYFYEVFLISKYIFLLFIVQDVFGRRS